MRIMTMTAVFLFSLLSFAGGNYIGNGGHVIVRDGQACFLDLYVNSICESGFIDSNQPPLFEPELTEAFHSEGFPSRMIAQKLREIYQADKVLAVSIKSTIQMLKWKMVTSNLESTGDSFYRPSRGEHLLQIAVQTDGVVLINKSLWTRLDDLNRAALVFHEALLYLWMRPDISDLSFSTASIEFRAALRRQIGFLFSKNVTQLDRESVAYHYGFRRFYPSIFQKLDSNSVDLIERPGEQTYILLKKDNGQKTLARLRLVRRRIDYLDRLPHTGARDDYSESICKWSWVF